MTDEPAGTFRPMAWALLSFVGWIAAFAMAFFLVATAGTIGILSGDAVGLRIDLAIVLALHGAIALAAVLVAAWLTLGAWPAVTARSAALPAVGVALAILVELALHEWAEARYGYYEAEFIGFTALLSLVLVACATSLFGVAVAPPGSVRPALAALFVAGAAVTFIVVSNLRGLGDGIGPGGWPLAVLVGMSAAYVLIALSLGFRRLRLG